MAVSKGRIDGALLLLRLVVGVGAILQGFQALPHRWKPTATSTWAIALALLKMIAGALTVVGVWTLPAALFLTAVAAHPFVLHLWRGGSVLSRSHELTQALTALACALGGGGRWSLKRD